DFPDGHVLEGSVISGNQLGGINSNSYLQCDGCRLFNNTYDILVNETSAFSHTVNLTSTIFDNPLGNLQNYTNISLNDSYTGPLLYTLGWSANESALPGATESFEQKFVNITNLSGSASIDSIIWHWTDAEAASYIEDRLGLWKYNASGWAMLNNSPDTGANELSLSNVGPFSTFAILQNNGCPAPIASPGTYVLPGNVQGAPNFVSAGKTACILISTSDVVFDCNGSSITNNGTAGTTYGVRADGGVENITLRNCPGISQYTNGVSFVDVNDSFLINNTAHSNYNNGFWLTTAGNGGSQRNVVENNTAYNNSDQGMYVLANNNNFTNNTAYDNNFGFYLLQTNAYENLLVENTARDNTFDGFRVSRSLGNTLVNNTAENNGNHGFIILTGSNGTGLFNNTARNNNRSGFSLLSSEDFLVYNNTARNNTLHGFWTDDGILYELDNNTAFNNTLHGFYLVNTNQSNLTGNLAFDNDVAGIYLSGSSNCTLENNTADDNGDDGVRLESSDDNDMLENTLRFNALAGFSANDSENLYLFDNVAYNNSDNGFTFTDSQHCELRNNLAFYNDRIGFDFWDGSAGETLTTNTAYLNGWDGFVFDGNGFSNLSLNTAYLNDGYGFLFLDSDYNNLSDDTAYLNTRDGFSFNGCTGNFLYRGTAYLNGGNGLSGTNNTGFLIMMDATAYLNNGSGVYVDDSMYVANADSTAYLNALEGFEYEDSDEIVLIGNTAYRNNGSGYLLANTSNASVVSNTGHSNNISAFAAVAGSSECEFEDNVAYNDTGFLLWDTDNMLLKWNTAANSSDSEVQAVMPPGYLLDDSGFVLINTTLAELYNNTAYNYTGGVAPDPNSFGFALFDSDDNMLVDNTAYGCGDSGFGAQDSNHNDFLNLESYGNSQAGLKIKGTGPGLGEFNTIQDSEFYGNGNMSVYLEDADNNIILDNLAYDSGLGYVLTGSGFNNLTNNTAYNTTGFVLAFSGENRLESNTAANTSSSALGAYMPGLDDSGFALFFAFNNTLVDNEVYSYAGGPLACGFVFSITLNNTLEDNLAHDNAGPGFALMNLSANNTFTNNTVYENSNGFAVINDSSGNLFEDNTVRDHLGMGFGIVNSSDNMLLNNEVFENSRGVWAMDSNNTRMEGDHLYNNTVDFWAENAPGSGLPFQVDLDTVVFDSPEGNLTNFTNLSLYDVHEPQTGFLVSWAAEPAALPVNRISFEEKYINISRRGPAENVSLDNVVWHWTDAEAAAYNENYLQLFEYNGSWNLVNASPDAGANTLSLSNAENFSIFAILQYTPDDDDDEDDFDGDLTVHVTTSCEGNVVEVLDGGAVSNADVTVTNQDTLAVVATGTTNSSGEFFFDGCSFEARVYVNKGGYTSNTVFRDLINCEFCEIECIDDDECEDDEECVDYECVEIECECGYIEDHACIEYECGDAPGCPPCPEGQVCQNHTCFWECSSDGDCADSQYCDIGEGADGGICTNVTGLCGYPENHTWVQYECGDEEGCEDCPGGMLCMEHECVESALDCPEEMVLGEGGACTARTGGEPCEDCEYVITDPAGGDITGRTLEDGTIVLPLEMEGVHKVALVSDGEVVREVEVEALPRAPPVEEEKPTQEGLDLASLLWLLLILLIVIFLIVYWRRRKQGRK
ncbi:hypothetical protein GF318_01635, partial [Candidatus Micrarchaeota archaeon]|nr:hypothetical protein [Candidatus Micrarchaeota archaeon]